ncbi:MAG: creatininase family protein [Candidatus Aminicenantes bacterium]|nr:creatininase family protein [Candidatus Aminicenantes bacterium]
MTSKPRKILLCFVMIFFLSTFSFSQQKSKTLILQEMSWVEVKDYLKSNNMVIIPLGSTEQHGPHMPMGTDYYEALEIAKK